MRPVIKKLILSLAAIGLFALYNMIMAPVVTVMSAKAAGAQMQSSDMAYYGSMYGMAAARNLLLPGILLFVLLLAIWWKDLRALFMSAMLLLALASPAHAYYSKQNYTEAVTIQPNDTAFWIPDTGDNLHSQVQMDSAQYYQSNKIAMKRFIIPHQLLSGSGWTAWGDYYVPTGRLILVDRSPYNREWTQSAKTGTSNRDQSIRCQDNNGLDVTVAMTVGASIKDQDAALFLSRFGVKPIPGNPEDPKIVFASLYYGRSLPQVMDTFGRGSIETMVCSEIASRSLDQVNVDALKILRDVRAKATAFLAKSGITLEYLGWADTFTFDNGVQDAINRRFIATKDQQIASMLKPYASTLQSLASADALRAFGHATDGRLPRTIVGLPAQVGSLMSTLLDTNPAPSTIPPAAQPPSAH